MLRLPFVSLLHISNVSKGLSIVQETFNDERIVLRYEPVSKFYFSLIQDDGKLKMYYRHQTINNPVNTWYDHEETRKLIYNEEKKYFLDDEFIFKESGPSHNFFVLPDRVDGKLVAIGGVFSIVAKSKGICLFQSVDGKKWQKVKNIILPENSVKQNYSTHFDSMNMVVYDRFAKEFLLYARYNQQIATRLVQRFRSKNLVDWSPCEICHYDKLSKAIYSPNIIQYPDSFLFLSLGNTKPKGKNTYYSFFSYSYDGVHFKVTKENFLEGSIVQEDEKINYQYRMVPHLRIKDKFWYFYVENIVDATLSEYKIRQDGFSSLATTGDTEESYTYKPLLLRSDKAVVNFRTTSGGFVIFAVLDAGNTILSMSDRMTGDEVARPIQWKNAFDISQPVHIMVFLKNANIYSVAFDAGQDQVKNAALASGL